MDPISDLQRTVADFYRRSGRHDLPWRRLEADGTIDAYGIVVSEFMLQQTQVARVIPKYGAFLKEFPDIHALARAPLAEVLVAWQGLGYNRRAKFLHQLACMVCETYAGNIPATMRELVALPGIGPNTAGAVLAYAYDEPVAFIETNIRTVFIRHFFHGATEPVPDRKLLPFIEAAVTRAPSSRTWYWGLMDYGSYLKRELRDRSARSSGTYRPQPRFEGSVRQLRGAVIRSLGSGPLPESELTRQICDDRTDAIMSDLIREGLLERRGGRIGLHGASWYD